MFHPIVTTTTSDEQFTAKLGKDERDAQERLAKALAQVESARGDWILIGGQIAVCAVDVRSISLRNMTSSRALVG